MPKRDNVHYCYKHADGTCKAGDKCPIPHMTNAEAKAKAGGKWKTKAPSPAAVAAEESDGG